MEWISVKRELPNAYETVLIYFCQDWNYDKHKIITTGYYLDMLNKFSTPYGYIYPTHWMHLPVPPKKKNRLLSG